MYGNKKLVQKEEKKATFEDYFYYLEIFCSIAGIPPFLANKNVRYYEIYSYIFRFFYFFGYCHFMYACYRMTSDENLPLASKVPYISYLCYGFEGYIKFLTIVAGRQELMQIMKVLKKMYHESLLSQELNSRPSEIALYNAKEIHEKLKSNSTVVNRALKIFFMAVNSYNIAPVLLTYFNLLKNGVWEPLFPLSLFYYPFDINQNYFFVVIFESIIACSNTSNMILPDAYICKILCHVIYNFQLVGTDFQKLLNQDDLSDAEQQKKVKIIIRKHNLLIDYAQRIHDIYAKALLVRQLTSATAICMVGVAFMVSFFFVKN